MNKKLIRLTESDLHKIVKESVNKVLTELDWKTYANYAKKRREQAYQDTFDNSGGLYKSPYHDKANDGLAMAKKAFNDKYFNGEDVPTDMEYKGVHMQEPFGGDRNYINRSLRTYNGLWKDSLSDDEAKNIISKDDKYGNFADSFIDAAHDKGDYYSGKSKYIKGKGWQ